MSRGGSLGQHCRQARARLLGTSFRRGVRVCEEDKCILFRRSLFGLFL